MSAFFGSWRRMAFLPVISQTQHMSEPLNGFIERVTCHNPENGFAVMRHRYTALKHRLQAQENSGQTAFQQT
jgi:hypothetical protein